LPSAWWSFSGPLKTASLKIKSGHEREPSAAKISTFHRYEAYALVLLALAGLVASGAVLIFALLNANGA